MKITNTLFLTTVALLFVFGSECIAITSQPGLASQYGILDLQANGGINPNTGFPWQAGDQYRLAFHTRDGISAESNDLSEYDSFANAQAQQNPALASSTGWKALITLSLNPNLPKFVPDLDGRLMLNPNMPLTDPRVESGTDDQFGGSDQGGAGVPVYAMDGSTSIARNNADIWNGWSNPFEDDLGVVNATGNGDNPIRLPAPSSSPAFPYVHYSPFLDQFASQTVDADTNHGKRVWTGSWMSGDPWIPLGTSMPIPERDRVDAGWGSSNANTSARVWTRFQSNVRSVYSLYVISEPLTVTQIPEPTSIAILGTGSLLLLMRRRG